MKVAVINVIKDQVPEGRNLGLAIAHSDKVQKPTIFQIIGIYLTDTGDHMLKFSELISNFSLTECTEEI